MFELREYQKKIVHDGVSILLHHKILYLALECRIGKTLISMQIAKECGYKSVLFVTKKKAIASIEHDYGLGSFKEFFDIVIINYESLHKIPKIVYDLVVVDEAHSLGSFPIPSIRAKRLRKIVKDKTVIYLSGTPTPESYSQIFHQLWISKNSPYYSYKNFYHWAANKYVAVQNKFIGDKRVKIYSKANRGKIFQDLSFFFISLTRSEAEFDITDPNEKIEHVSLDKATINIIHKIFDFDIIKGKYANLTCDSPLRKMQKMHQLCSGTVLLDNGKFHIMDYSKVEHIKRTINLPAGIFYKYKAEYEVLKEYFPDHTTVPGEFDKGNNDLIVLQIIAGREGVKLKRANELIFYNIDFSATSYFQAKDRLIDKTRESPAKVRWIFSRGGIEDRIYKVVKNKTNFTTSHFKHEFYLGK
ncbi:MAG TPA: SNF2-related protein [Victivallales bacterium]|nr:SNF2-related protein [Victivallales bacterium]